jgi:hypothetical protein
MSLLDRYPNCQSQRLVDISSLYSGWETIADRLQQSSDLNYLRFEKAQNLYKYHFF